MRPFDFGLSVLLIAAGAACMVPRAHGQEPREFGGAWELGAFSGMIDDRPEFEPTDGAFRIAHEGMLGLRAARSLPTDFFLEAELLYAPMELAYTSDGERRRHALRAISWLAAAGYTARAGARLQWLVRAAAGGIRWRGPASHEIDFLFGAGGGARYFIASGLALRGDLNLHMAPSALSGVRRELLPEFNSPGEVLWLGSLTAGLSACFLKASSKVEVRCRKFEVVSRAASDRRS